MRHLLPHTPLRLLPATAVLLLLVAAPAPGAGPRAGTGAPELIPPLYDDEYTYLTWSEEDMASTITIHVLLQEFAPVLRLYYDTEPGNRDLNGYENGATVLTTQIEGLDDVYIAHFHLTGLQPATRYYFMAGLPALGGFSEEYSFRTLPGLPGSGLPLRLVAGGDMNTHSIAAELCASAATLDPHAAIIGGDIAYALGNLEKWGKWDEWLTNWTENMVTTDGRLVPMILAIGDGEVRSRGQDAVSRAPFYFGLFQQTEELTYFTRSAGRLLSVHVLDSGVINPVSGAQTQWLADELVRTANARQHIAVYHNPMYPSKGDPSSPIALEMKENWAPLFDEAGVEVALEHHFHTLKRTFPVFGDEVASAGTVYLGDGAWGQELAVPVQGREYIVVSESENHFWLLDVWPNRIEMQAIDENGQVLDSYTHIQ